MKIFVWISVGAGAVIGIFVLDGLALWMERKGWLYYRKTKRRTGAHLGDAFLEVQSLFEPDKRYMLEMRKEEKEDETESGEPPEAGKT